MGNSFQSAGSGTCFPDPADRLMPYRLGRRARSRSLYHHLLRDLAPLTKKTTLLAPSSHEKERAENNLRPWTSVNHGLHLSHEDGLSPRGSLTLGFPGSRMRGPKPGSQPGFVALRRTTWGTVFPWGKGFPRCGSITGRVTGSTSSSAALRSSSSWPEGKSPHKPRTSKSHWGSRKKSRRA